MDKELPEIIYADELQNWYLYNISGETKYIRADLVEHGIDISKIVIGSRLKYRDGVQATVFDITDKVWDGMKEPVDGYKPLHTARIHASTDNGGGRFYTHRRDGVSHIDKQSDIIEII